MQKVYLQDVESIINKYNSKELATRSGAEFDTEIVDNTYMGYFRKLRAVSYGSAFHCLRKFNRTLGIKPREPQSLIVERATRKLDGHLDIVRVLKGLRKVEVLSRVILS